MNDSDLKALESTLGHTFRDPALLMPALTHASFVSGPQEGLTYERLEFLGDRVLGLAVADMLDERFPEAPEGELSRRLARLVSGETCALVAGDMGLARFLRIGESIQRGSSRATAGVLADVCESVLGAVYRDGGLPAARRIVDRYWRPRMDSMSGPLRDAKTELQEWAHRRAFDTPRYIERERSGPDHAPEFVIEVAVGSVEPGVGRGRSKREAEHEAASNVLRREGVWDQN